MRKRHISLCAAIVVSLMGGSQYALAQASNDWKLFTILPITGSNAAYAVEFKLGFEIARDEINSKGGINGRKVDLTILDSQSNNGQVVSLVRTACADGVALLGPSMSAEARVAFTLANSLNCPAISSSAAASGLTEEARPWTFTYATPASILTPAAIDGLIKKLSPKKSVVILDKANPAALDQGELSAKAMAAKGVSVETFTVATNDVDFGPIATRIAGVSPDLVVISTSDKAALGLLREFKRTQQKAAILITQSAFTPLISAAGAELLEGVYRYTEFDPTSASDNRTKAFITEFKKRNDGRAPTQLSTQTYDLMFLMKDMIEKAGAKGTRDSLQSDRKQIADLLGGLKEWQSISGPMSMTPGGYTVKPATVLVFRNGVPERVSGL